MDDVFRHDAAAKHLAVILNKSPWTEKSCLSVHHHRE